jgi:hypothetical protein
MKKIWTVIRSVLLIIAGVFTLLSNTGEEQSKFVTYLSVGLLAIGVIDLLVMGMGNKEKQKVEEETKF